MNLIAATRAEGGLVFIDLSELSFFLYRFVAHFSAHFFKAMLQLLVKGDTLVQGFPWMVMLLVNHIKVLETKKQVYFSFVPHFSIYLYFHLFQVYSK